MTVFEIIEKRRSIRNFNEGEIPSKDLDLILKAAQLAPSASNMQPYQFIIVQDPQTKKDLGKLASQQRFISKAGAIIIGIGDPLREKWYKVDIAIAIEHMILVATELGYGTCWIGSFDENSMKNFLGIPNNLQIVALLPIGISGQSAAARPRKKFDELFFWEKYNYQLNKK